MSTLSAYMKFANHPEHIGVAISCDEDDPSMSRNLVHEEIHRILRPTAWHRIFTSANKNKIEACNANIHEVTWEWDIVVLVSDDMIPQVQGYDDVIRAHMTPDRNRILWFNDGHQGEKLNTLCIFGRAMYDHFGCLYNPEYKSLFCDTELTDLCKGELKSRCSYSSYCIIRHEHPGTGFAQNMDSLYQQNQKYWNEDMYTYIRRKTYAYDVSFLIPTIQGREKSLENLQTSIREKMSRLAPQLRYVINLAYDNRQISVGVKRQNLLQAAEGKYFAFVDDDDEITDAYVEDMAQAIQGSYPVMRLRGQIGPYTFTHSLENTVNGNMARGSVFLRPPNHLNPMMSDVGKLVHFKDATRGEDLDWTLRMSRAGFLTHEYTPDDARIHYIYNMGDRKVDPNSLVFQQQTSYDTMLSMLLSPSGVGTPQPPHEQRLRLTPRGFVSR